MLTPDQMDAAGEEVAAVYRQIEAELIDYLVGRMIDGDVSGQRARTALDLLAQADPEQLRRIIDAHAEEVDAAARRDVERHLAASDAFDLAAIAAGMAVTAPEGALTAQTLAVTASVREMIARDNLEMSNAARTKFLQWSTWAATQTATGNMTADKAMRRAVRELARGGLSIESVTYRDPETGKVTVTNKADVAVQRHIRSLIGQGAAALTFERMRQNGVEFVEVSSHIGSRPSHAEWQGRCYHVGGAVEVGGVRYEDFAFGTGYRGECGPYTALGDQLMGVNCRHSFAPWVPGGPRAYSPDPESPTGLPNEEIYKLTQGQRARERKIREAKRELAAMQRVHDADPTPENAAELAKAKALLRGRQERMRAYIAEANAKCRPGTEVLKRMPSREWAGDMPKGRPIGGSAAGNAATGSMAAKIDIEIDELTPCLRRTSDRAIVGTTVEVVKTGSTVLEDGLWEFDWAAQAGKSDKVLALLADGDDRVQGLAALRDTPEISAVTLDLAESAPWNSKHNKEVKGQEYLGVGGHLFALAVRESYERGYNGFVAFTAKTKLVDYYAKAFGATRIAGTANMYIDENAARRLYERYFRAD
ncbi:phage minor capsid protein [Adlercreutzia muris]|uniref:phage minor capsid protein n=1 Tax=Adlercreutzia muris TaxID=1796610 RepID=UPI001365C813|nr:phage minor capsid protein [Adlercreutzia muris]NCA32131.1 hypothetical protein [Adlercreutzia muris]